MNFLDLAPHLLADEAVIGMALRHGAQLDQVQRSAQVHCHVPATHAIRFTLMLRASSTCARSYSICMPSHTSGLDPNALERRNAISAELPPLPFTKLFSAWRVTPRRFAVSVTVNPNGSRHSWGTNSPGWGGVV